MDLLLNLKFKAVQSFNNVLIKNCTFHSNVQDCDCMEEGYARSTIEIDIPNTHAAVSFEGCNFTQNNHIVAII